MQRLSAIGYKVTCSATIPQLGVPLTLALLNRGTQQICGRLWKKISLRKVNNKNIKWNRSKTTQ